jgi:hypothetical protein
MIAAIFAAYGCGSGSDAFMPLDDAGNVTGGAAGKGGAVAGAGGHGATGNAGAGGSSGMGATGGSSGGSAGSAGGAAAGSGGADPCGNGALDPGEQCDGSELGGQSCATVLGGNATGNLACSAACSFDTTQCCVPNCLGNQCGPDGCGSTCGSCASNQSCVDGKCVCVPSCSGKQCGSDSCGGSCGSCPSGTACSSGQCVCTPSCSGKSCGPNGCGGSCGTCASGSSCQAGVCIKTSCDYAYECGDIQTKICDPRTRQCALAQCSSTKPCSVSSDKCIDQAVYGVGACYPTCKFLAGGTCSSGTQCQPIKFEPDEGLCLHTGSAGAGSTCTVTSSSNGCISGHICTSDFGVSGYRCNKTCSFSAGTGCLSGQRCSLYNFCSASGDPAAIGQTCAAGPGNTCAPQGGIWAGLCDWQKVCRKVCKKGVSGECPSGQTCIDNVSVEGYGTCS